MIILFNRDFSCSEGSSSMAVNLDESFNIFCSIALHCSLSKITYTFDLSAFRIVIA